MCRPTAALERLLHEIGFRLIDQVLMLSNDYVSSCPLRFVTRSEKTSAKSDGASMDEPNNCGEPVSNELQSPVIVFRLRIYFWVHAILLGCLVVLLQLQSWLREGDGIAIAGRLRFAGYSHGYGQCECNHDRAHKKHHRYSGHGRR
jgi:hypothetical protein